MSDQPPTSAQSPQLLEYETPRKARRLSKLAIASLICGSIAGPVSFIPVICVGVLCQLFSINDDTFTLLLIIALILVPVILVGIAAMGVKTIRLIERDPFLRGRKYAYYGAFIAMIWIMMLFLPVIIGTLPFSISIMIRVFRWLQRSGFQMAY